MHYMPYDATFTLANRKVWFIDHAVVETISATCCFSVSRGLSMLAVVSMYYFRSIEQAASYTCSLVCKYFQHLIAMLNDSYLLTLYYNYYIVRYGGI